MDSADHRNGVSSAVPPLQTSDASAQLSSHINNAAPPQEDPNSALVSQHTQNIADWTAIPYDGDQTLDVPGDLWSAAYREAVDGLGKDVDVAILKGSSVVELFKQLEEIDKNVSQESAFLRGVAFLRSIQVPLERFKLALDLALPLSSMEPIAGTVFGVVKGVTAIAITFASADLEFAKQIGQMLGQLSYIDDCDTLGQKTNRQDIHRALVLVYQKVLEFYQVAYEILTRRGAKLMLKMVLESDRLPSVVEDFLRNADNLRKLIEKATLEIAEDIKTMLYDHDIDRWLGSNKASLQSRYHANLQELRSNEACAFLLDHPDFEKWYDATGPEWLVIFGDMGHGKTVAMSFIIDELQRRNKQQLPQPKICYHYCRNDETGQSSYIFSALILTLLQQFAGLKKTFHKWYKEKQASGIQDPAQNTRELADFLEAVVKTIDRPLFIVLDGLDECDRVSRAAFLKLWKTFRRTTSRLKIIISSRPERRILEQVYDAPRINLDSDGHRDAMIVRYAVENQLSYLSDQVKTLVIETLSRLAQGSAIWTKMTVNLIESTQIEDWEPMRHFLKHMSLPDQLSQLYTTMFVRYSNDNPENKSLARTALKLLAVARRPLSVQELAWSVAIALARNEVTSVADLTQLVDHRRVVNLIHPFIIRPDFKDLGKRQLRLAHQSVNDFVLHEWHLLQDFSTGTIPIQLKAHEQVDFLESFILNVCIDYLLMDEIGNRALFSEAQIAIDALPQEVDLFDDIQPSQYDPSCTWETWEEHMIRYDPVERGFGHFFVYAASHWLQHLSAVQSGDLPDLTKIERICQAGSFRLHNWINQNCRPDCVIKARFEFDSRLYDPLSIVSLYGSDAMLHRMLRVSSLDKDKFLPTPALAAADQILQWGSLPRLRILFLEPKITCQLHNLDFFRLIMRQWSQNRARHDDWSAAFDLVEVVLDTLVQEHWGSELLCVAAREGCMPIMQRLLSNAQYKSDLRTELLRGSQSIAQAVLGDHADVVELLLAQEGFGAHLEYANSHSEHILHLACRTCNPAIFRLLVPCLQGRLHQTDSQGRTAIVRVVDSHATPQNRYEAAKILLLSSASSCSFGLSDEEENPLRHAVRLGDADMCRLLIYEGNLNPNSALTCNRDGSVVLKDKPPANEDAISKLLREVASTMN